MCEAADFWCGRRKAVCGQQRGQAVRHHGATLAYLAANSSFETVGQLVHACMQIDSRDASHACMVNPLGIEYSVSRFSGRGSTRIRCTPVLFTSTGNTEFTSFRVHIYHIATQYCTSRGFAAPPPIIYLQSQLPGTWSTSFLRNDR